MALTLKVDSMNYLEIFNNFFNSRGNKGYFIIKREALPGPIKSLRILSVDLYWHCDKRNILVKNFQKKGTITEDKKADYYAQLDGEVLSYLFERRDTILRSYGI